MKSDLKGHIVSTRTEFSLEIVKCSCGWLYFADDYEEAYRRFKEHLKSESIND